MGALRHVDARRIWLQVHLWLGLTLGVVGALVGLTGSALVFDHELDSLLNPQRYAVTGSQVALSYADYGQRATQALEGRARPANLRLPEGEGLPIVVLARARAEGGGFHRVYLDPPTGRVLDVSASGGFIGWAHSFHESLTLRAHSGREIVGAVGIAMLISSLSGLYLWWPTGGLGRRAFGFRPGFAPSRNLHYTFGFYGSLVLALLSFTGVFLAYPEPGRAIVGGFGPVSASSRGIQAPESSGRPIPPDDAVAIARALYPEAKVASLGLPAGPRGAYRVSLRAPGDSSARFGPVVFLDPRSGAVLNRMDRGTRTRGDAFLVWQRVLHEGEAFGIVGRIVICSAGALPALLVVTGAMIWLRQRRKPRTDRVGAAAAVGSNA
ncbi:MAG TPA: PepSY-associated TM helix domain-containing protein [Burkholderiales bacterium]|nr:PepSY-associated TM helix domain-containing protein [Burkholderiales bacterium]